MLAIIAIFKALPLPCSGRRLTVARWVPFLDKVVFPIIGFSVALYFVRGVDSHLLFNLPAAAPLARHTWFQFVIFSEHSEPFYETFEISSKCENVKPVPQVCCALIRGPRRWHQAPWESIFAYVMYPNISCLADWDTWATHARRGNSVVS